jgi:hypothetical protein
VVFGLVVEEWPDSHRLDSLSALNSSSRNRANSSGRAGRMQCSECSLLTPEYSIRQGTFIG